MPFNDLGKSFESFLHTIFDTPDVHQRVRELDTFFAARIQPINPQLREAVDRIVSSKGDIRVNELADAMQCSRNTLLRLFKKHLTCSVEEYRKMVKFRLTFDEMQRQSNAPLTHLALENKYYDQAEFIRQFKSLTHALPSKLKQQLTSLGPNGPFWRIQE